MLRRLVMTPDSDVPLWVRKKRVHSTVTFLARHLSYRIRGDVYHTYGEYLKVPIQPA